MRVSLARVLPLFMSLVFLGCDIGDLAVSARHKEDFEHTYPFSSGGRLSVESFNGSIDVIGWDREEVLVEGTKYASSEELLAALKVDIVATEDFIQVRTVRPSGRRGNMGAKYIIHAPRRIELDRLTSSNGSIKVDDAEGTARLKTSNGRIEVARFSGSVEARTSNGGISLGDTEGDAILETSNGSIKAEHVGGSVNARTSNGRINLGVFGDGGGKPIKARSSNGSVTVTLERQPTSDIEISTSNSNITLRAPAALAASLEASTSNSSIKTDFDVTIQGTQRKSRLNGSINGGGPRIELDTSNGGIRIEKIGAEGA